MKYKVLIPTAGLGSRLEKYTKYLNDPLVKFFVLCLICLSQHYDNFLALVILFAYLLTVVKNYPVLKSANNLVSNDSITYPINIEDTVLSNSELKENTQQEDVYYMKDTSANNNEFTTDFQFNDAQSNIVNNEALETEVRTWKDGYGTQGGFDLES